MLFDTLRQARALKLAVLFGFAAASGSMGMPRENPEMAELRTLTRQFSQGSLTAGQFMRMTDLSQRLADDPQAVAMLTNSGLICGHASGSGSGGAVSGSAMACPAERRRRAQGDLSHLLVFHHWV